jgi:hypothetical protein
MSCTAKDSDALPSYKDNRPLHTTSDINEPLYYLKRPIDIQRQIRTMSLCINRILQEPGLTRVIDSYYKNLLWNDVWDRIEYIISEFHNINELDDYTRALIAELNNYLEYYLDHTWIMSSAMVALAKGSWSDPQVRATVVMTYFDVFLRATQAHTHDLVFCFVQYLHGNFNDPDVESRDTTGPFTEWSVRFFERIFESAAMELVLHMVDNVDTYCHLSNYQLLPHMPLAVASTLQDVNFVLSVYLSNSPTNPHFATYMVRLTDAVQRMDQKIAELGQDDSDGDSDQDNDNEE